MDTVTVRLEAREMSWEPRPGLVVPGYGFNGTVPGPVIGALVGDTVEVTFENSLAEPTTIHWHGLRVPSDMDGTALVQQPVRPGETFVYRFTVPDAATLWYHPHTNETEQLEKGLYGPLVIRDPDDPVFDREQVIVLDDLKLDATGALAPFGGRRERHDGRRGDVLLANGRAVPVLDIAAGQVERWRIINAASSRYVQLSLGGHTFRLIGTDGGLIDGPPHPVTRTLLAPAERVDLAVGPFRQGETFPLASVTRGKDGARDESETYATISVGPSQPSMASVLGTLRTIEPLAPLDAQPTRVVRLQGRVSLRRGVDWLVDGHTHHQADPVRVGDLQVWDIRNESRMDHPFHLHGFFFQVLAINGTPPPYRSWKDTVNVPPAATVRIAWLPDDRPGSWMYHCHILEHHAAGMMAHFEVVR